MMLRKVLFNPRFWLYFVAPQIIFVGISVGFSHDTMQPLFSAVIFALSLGINVAFMPSTMAFFNRSGPLDRTEALCLGIQATWFSRACVGAWSLFWRYEGQPLWLINNDLVAYFNYLNILGALMHLAAPGAIKDHIPATRWVKIGALVAIASFATFAVMYFTGIYAEVSPHIGRP